MSHLRDVERTFRALLFAREPEGFVDVDPARQAVYRRLVRNTLFGAIKRACPHARRLGGEDVFSGFVARFLDESPPTTRLLRDVPTQFTAWLQTLPEDELPHPSYAELCAFEALEIDVLLAKTAPPAPPEVLPDDELDARAVVLDPSARIAVTRHPVHRVTHATTTWPQASGDVYPLLCFQRDEAFVVEVVSPAVAQVLVACAGGARVGEALHRLGDVDADAVRRDLRALCPAGAVRAFA